MSGRDRYALTNPGLALLVVICMLVNPARASANGGKILKSEEVGKYEITITAASLPLRAGANEISVLLRNISDGRLILDAAIAIVVEPLDGSSPAQSFIASHEQATNKLYYAASVYFPEPGEWAVGVEMESRTGSAATRVIVRVEPGNPVGPRVYEYLETAAGAAMLLVAFGLGQRFRRTLLKSKR